MTQQPPRQRFASDRQPAEANPSTRSGAAERDPSGGVWASKPAEPVPPGLYLTAVPIGNARDITLRALDTLAAVDAIACEDTRVTAKLLRLYGISGSLISYHDHNADKMRPAILKRIAAGQSVALVSDAGTPLVSDPGYKLVRAAQEQGLPVTCLPGASAPLAGLLLSGLPSDRFLFAGFPPSRSGPRRAAFAELAAVPATLVFFESARRLPASLADLAAVLGDREAAVARELTKRFEEARHGTLGSLAEHYRIAGPPKGEVVVVVGPPGVAEAPAEAEIDAMLRDALDGLSLRDAVAAVAAATGQPRRAVYRRALAVDRPSRTGNG